MVFTLIFVFLSSAFLLALAVAVTDLEIVSAELYIIFALLLRKLL
jgi:hypothetical protein